MPSEEDLRSALASGVAFLDPDVEHELGRVLSTATTRARARRTSYVAAVAAAVALAVVLLGHDWRPAAAPEPARQDPVHDLPSGVGRYASPADLTPGRWNVDFLPDRWPHRVEAVVDVPAGWGQDDRFSLATGPGRDPATRRIDFFAGRDASLARCEGTGLGADPSSLEVARALASLAPVSASDPEPVTVGGHRGYLVELRDPASGTVPACHDRDSFLFAVPGVLSPCPGFTTLAWVFDIDGQVLTVYGSYGSEVTSPQREELVRMVETATYTVR